MIQIYSDIHSYKDFHECHTLVHISYCILQCTHLLYKNYFLEKGTTDWWRGPPGPSRWHWYRTLLWALRHPRWYWCFSCWFQMIIKCEFLEILLWTLSAHICILYPYTSWSSVLSEDSYDDDQHQILFFGVQKISLCPNWKRG